jgi:hypothetical protein
MSRVMTKPTLCVCDQHGSRPACASAQSDQDPCCSLMNRITSRETDSEQHGSWSDCADAQAGLDPCWSQTHYVGFGAAHMLNFSLTRPDTCTELFLNNKEEHFILFHNFWFSLWWTIILCVSNNVMYNIMCVN